MPRTKAARVKQVEKPSKFAQDLIPVLENQRKLINDTYKQKRDEFMLQLRNELKKSQLSIPQNIASKTIGELMELPQKWSGNSTSVSSLQVLDMTKTMAEKRRPLVRSSSFDDEGYLTAESSKSTSDGRKSRARSRATKNSTRTSRSLSTRSKTVNNYKTPAHRVPPSSYGTVTPKVKPNTPQVLLRRPKQGEFALSLQGSPLLTGNVVADNVANINIPLEDGRLLTIQPQRGLRISQIPQLDPETKRQLETLRDNLNKVCALSAKK